MNKEEEKKLKEIIEYLTEKFKGRKLDLSNIQ